MSASLRFVVVACVAIAVVALWALRSSDRAPAISRDAPAPIRERIDARFAGAEFIKPDEASSSDPLAPLLMLEHRGAEDRRTVEFGVPGPRGIETQAPALWVTESEAVYGGHRLEQRTYFWWQRPAGSAEEFELQGIRITLDSKGHPLVHEVHEDRTGERPIYIARRAETAARDEFGAPVEGRVHAVERAVDDASGVVVARVLEDGPVTMGPWVYISRDLDVTTLLCRCMDSQIDPPLTERVYSLRAWDPAAGSAPCFDDRSDPRWLERVLRLPARVFD